MRKVNFLGIPFISISTNGILDCIKQNIESETALKITFINYRLLFKSLISYKTRNMIQQFDIIIPQGRFLINQITKIYPNYEYQEEERLDLISTILANYQTSSHNFMILGGSQVGANKLTVNLQASFPGVKLIGIYSKPFLNARKQDVLEMIRKGDVRLIFLGLGKILDEKWIIANQKYLHKTVSICTDDQVSLMTGDITTDRLLTRYNSKTALGLFLKNPWQIWMLIYLKAAIILFKWNKKKLDKQKEV